MSNIEFSVDLNVHGSIRDLMERRAFINFWSRKYFRFHGVPQRPNLLIIRNDFNKNSSRHVLTAKNFSMADPRLNIPQ